MSRDNFVILYNCVARRSDRNYIAASVRPLCGYGNVTLCNTSRLHTCCDKMSLVAVQCRFLCGQALTQNQKALVIGALTSTPNSYISLHCCNFRAKAYEFVEIFISTDGEKTFNDQIWLFLRSIISKRIPLKSIYFDISGKSKFFCIRIIVFFFGES